MSTQARREIEIRPREGPLAFDFREHWEARYMFAMLVKRRLRGAYGDLYFWMLWASARPVMYTFIFVLFRNWSDARTGTEVPYPVFLYSGLVFWYYFMETSIEVANSMRANVSLVTKIYIPTMVLPTVPVVGNLLDLCLNLIPLGLLMIYYDVAPGWHFILALPALATIMILAMGSGLLVAAIAYKIRDVQKIFEFVLYAGMFASPVIFAPHLVPEGLRSLYNLNPMVGALELWRSALFHGGAIPWNTWPYALGFAICVFILGVRIYRRHERELVEAI